MSRKKRVRVPQNALDMARLAAEVRREDPVFFKARRACDRYRLKLEQGLSPARSDRDVQKQLAGFRQALMMRQVCDDQVKNLLYPLGVLPCNVLNYLTFSRQIDRLKRRFMGKSLANRARQVAETWVMRGLEMRLLRAILQGVFNVTLTEELSVSSGSAYNRMRADADGAVGRSLPESPLSP